MLASLTLLPDRLPCRAWRRKMLYISNVYVIESVIHYLVELREKLRREITPLMPRFLG
jgi:hypothetical protein